MAMGATVFFLIYGFIVTFLVLRLFLVKKDTPTALKMENEKRASQNTPQEINTSFSDSTGGPTGERSLNCYFQYNGHLWDAFEVLGIPAGSDHEACERALLDLKRKSGTDGEFMKVCGTALETHFRKG